MKSRKSFIRKSTSRMPGSSHWPGLPQSWVNQGLAVSRVWTCFAGLPESQSMPDETLTVIDHVAMRRRRI